MSSSSLNTKLWYKTPAKEWNEALPIGNGRLGAMVHGRTTTEMLCLNEDSIWYGGPQQRSSPDTHKHLPQLRKHIRNGEHEKAEKLVEQRFMCSPWSQRHYEPLGNVMIDFDHKEDEVSNYSRSLDLETATARVDYLWNRVNVSREMIASYPDNVLAFKICSSGPIEFVVRLSRLGHIEYETNEFLDEISVRDGNKLVMHVTPGGHGSIRACCSLGVEVDKTGVVEAANNQLFVSAKECIIFISARTTFRHNADFTTHALDDIAKSMGQVEEIWSRHRADYNAQYNRMSLVLDSDQEKDSLPTNERLLQHVTPGLLSLYHSYARYLLISSARPSVSLKFAPLDLPANLQGIWNPSFAPAWGSKFTININIQMNHFPVFTSNIPSTASPLFSLLERMAKIGRRTAKDVYECRGWCCHTNTDIWADTDVADRWMPASLWPLGGAWLCLIIWEHYLFTLDISILRRMFPVLEGAVEFVLETLIPDEDGIYLITSPSLSPENTFIDDNGKEGRLCEGSTIDISIISALLSAFLSANKELTSTNPTTPQNPLISSAEEALTRLPPLTISRTTSRIQEWGHKNDYKDAEPGHRHTSHLFALYPGNSITLTSTPSLAHAAKKVLDHRAQHGGGHTGWSRAWNILFWTRLHDAEKVRENLALLLQKSTLVNLLDSHPPFQIDGNFGGAAGILEAVVQSHEVDDRGDRVVRVLAGCPWKEGKVRGVGVRGGWKVGFAWREGQVVGEVEFRSVSLREGNSGRRDGGEGGRGLVLVFPPRLDGSVRDEVRITELRERIIVPAEGN